MSSIQEAAELPPLKPISSKRELGLFLLPPLPPIQFPFLSSYKVCWESLLIQSGGALRDVQEAQIKLSFL